jgi:uncharacterized delta-60 repeat protein
MIVPPLRAVLALALALTACASPPSSGALDQSFARSGRLSFIKAEGPLIPALLESQRDGKLLIGATLYQSQLAGLQAPARQKYLALRDPPTSTSVASGQAQLWQRLAILPGAPAAVVPSGIAAQVSVNRTIFIVRMTKDGQLDPTIGFGGTLPIDFSPTLPEAGSAINDLSDVAVTAAGDIYVLATLNIVISKPGPDEVTQNVMLMRMQPNSDLRQSFAGGIITLDWNLYDFGARLSLLDGDGVLVSGNTLVPQAGKNPQYQMVFAKFDQNGQPDPKFGDQGRLISNFAEGDMVVTDVLAQADGGVIFIGVKVVLNPTTAIVEKTTAILGRLDASGQLDRHFAAGKLVYDFGTEFSAFTALVAHDGAVFVVGNQGSRNSRSSIVLRLASDGQLDRNFATGGVLTSDLKVPATLGSSALPRNLGFGAVATGNDQTNNGTNNPQRLYLLGALDQQGAVARYQLDGRLDTSFAKAGIASDSFFQKVFTLNLQPDGKIVVLGSKENAMITARYLP